MRDVGDVLGRGTSGWLEVDLLEELVVPSVDHHRAEHQRDRRGDDHVADEHVPRLDEAVTQPVRGVAEAVERDPREHVLYGHDRVDRDDNQEDHAHQSPHDAIDLHPRFSLRHGDERKQQEEGERAEDERHLRRQPHEHEVRDERRREPEHRHRRHDLLEVHSEFLSNFGEC